MKLVAKLLRETDIERNFRNPESAALLCRDHYRPPAGIRKGGLGGDVNQEKARKNSDDFFHGAKVGIIVYKNELLA